jgi:cyclophilin family peptidyl-prolyl cis-trans isomerase
MGANAPAQATQDPDHPVVAFETSLGEITVRLDAQKAPLTVANFLAYVGRGHYDGTIFHQVVKEYPKLVIGGAFTKELTEKPTMTSVRNEAHSGLKNRRGTIAMARRPDWIDSATCHFFINVTDNEVLDHTDRTLEGYGYCVFGEVIEGMDVVDRIAALEVHDTEQFEQIPVETVAIQSVRVVR